MKSISLQDAYREACLALGEATVKERLLVAELEQLTSAREQVADGDAQPEA